MDTTTRIVAALMLALLIVVPIAGPVCSATAMTADCATRCAQAGYMPVQCPGDECGGMTPAQDRPDQQPVVSSVPQQAPVVVAASVPQRLDTSADSVLVSMEDSRVERPPLDPLGVRIRI